MLVARHALAAAAVLGLLATHLLASAPPLTPLADAERSEGERVRVRGIVRGFEARDGTHRFDVVGDGTTIAVVDPAPGEPLLGWVEVVGQLTRRGGVMSILAEDVAPVPASTPILSLAQLAADPTHWVDRPVEVDAVVQGGHLTDAEGHRILLRANSLRAGSFAGTILLAYEPNCLCYVASPVPARA